MNPQRYAAVGKLTLQQTQTDKNKVINELSEAVGGAQETLVSATTTFPFVLFPDTICVDRTKVTINRQTFFNVGQVMSIQVEDILNVTANVGPFFGSLKITTRYFDTKKPPYTINYLKREDALRVKRIIQGYIVAKLKEIDCSVLSTKELAHMLDELGKGEQE
jgi:hypothetical protein